LAGGLKYDVKKFFVACTLGKILMSIVIAYAGYASLGWLASFL
jgi:membrane protein DedA with SNARE-associated domain